MASVGRTYGNQLWRELGQRREKAEKGYAYDIREREATAHKLAMLRQGKENGPARKRSQADLEILMRPITVPGPNSMLTGLEWFNNYISIEVPVDRNHSFVRLSVDPSNFNTGKK